MKCMEYILIFYRATLNKNEITFFLPPSLLILNCLTDITNAKVRNVIHRDIQLFRDILVEISRRISV